MPILNKLSAAFPAALVYITVGALIDIWSVMWYVYYPPETKDGYFWIVGFMVTGLVLLTIGLFLGRIGRAARQAELPPHEVTGNVIQVEKTAAANAQPAAPDPSSANTAPASAAPLLPIPASTPVVSASPPSSSPPSVTP